MTTELPAARRYGHYVNGEEVLSATYEGVINPATGEIFAECAVADDALVDFAVSAAASAQRDWGRDQASRRVGLALAADMLEADGAAIALLLTQEQGKPLAQSRLEIGRAAMWLRYYAALSDDPIVLHDENDRRVVGHRRPLGVVAAITPWNFPIFSLAWKLAPALLAGNTVVAKPSPFTPLSSLALAKTIGRAFPPGVLNVVCGGADAGTMIVRHPGIRKVSFTGSTATGKLVMSNSADTLKRVTLELGGNDPAIVLDDVDPDAVAERIYWGAFYNGGQICIAIKRLYVHDRIYTRLINLLTARAKATRVGDGLDAATEMGPINNLPQLDRVTSLVEDATSSGATIATGGQRLDRPGYFYPPTLVTDANSRMRLVDEEQFGPALPIIRYTDLDDAIEQANASPFGLGASVWTSDVARGEQIVSRIDCGTGWVNQHRDLLPYAPFGGWKNSGIGYESGRPGYDEFTRLQIVNSRIDPDASDGLDDLRGDAG
jgi:acyl-CoA reductase-like NAD-dependent aldehyde dehydrogenase